MAGIFYTPVKGRVGLLEELEKIEKTNNAGPIYLLYKHSIGAQESLLKVDSANKPFLIYHLEICGRQPNIEVIGAVQQFFAETWKKSDITPYFRDYHAEEIAQPLFEATLAGEPTHYFFNKMGDYRDALETIDKFSVSPRKVIRATTPAAPFFSSTSQEPSNTIKPAPTAHKL